MEAEKATTTNAKATTMTLRRGLADISNKVNSMTNIAGGKGVALDRKVSGKPFAISGDQENVKGSANNAATSSSSSSSCPMPHLGAPSLDEVDVKDAKDIRYVTDYATDIYENFLAAEPKLLPSPTYMSSQTDITARMRAILIDWLVEVHLKFKLLPQTLYITVNILDRYLERRVVMRDELQLIGCTALWCASKIEEIYSPEVQDFVLVSDRAFKRQDLLAMEGKLLNALEFKLTFPTHYAFLTRWSKVANADRRVKLLALYCVERTLQEYVFLKYRPSMIAAAGLLVAMEAQNGPRQWSSLLEKHTGYSESALSQCTEEIRALVKDAENRSLLAVRKKYLTEEHGYVAKINVGRPGATA